MFKPTTAGLLECQITHKDARKGIVGTGIHRKPFVTTFGFRQIQIFFDSLIITVETILSRKSKNTKIIIILYLKIPRMWSRAGVF